MTTTKVTTINVAARQQPHQGPPSGRVAVRSSSPATRIERTIFPGVKRVKRRLAVPPPSLRRANAGAEESKVRPGASAHKPVDTPTTPPDIMKLHLCLFSVAVRSCTVLAAQHAHRDTLHASSPSGHLAQCMH